MAAPPRRTLADGAAGRQFFPLECVQLIQDSFADALGVMILLTDLEGHPITQPSNPCGLYQLGRDLACARQRCLDLWASIASEPSMAPRFEESHLGCCAPAA